jgi:hypothetical protein
MKVRSGLMNQCSFAFRVTRQAWSEDHDEREISEVSLHRGDVSVCNFGANPTTPVAVRALLANVAALTETDRDELRSDPAVMAAVRELAAVPTLDDLVAVLTEVRAGATLSGATAATVKHVLSLCAAADQAMDTAQPLLADLLGVPNPDQDAPQSNGLSLDLARARAHALRTRTAPRRSA